MTRKATINDVAARAGVSIKTVSRVLNGEQAVRPDTRQRVRAAVEALNYRPSRSARSLASGRSYLIGLLYHNPSANYVVDVQHGALDKCLENGFHLFSHPTDLYAPDLGGMVANLVHQANLDGLILTPPLCSSPALLAELDRQHIPFVRVSPVDRTHPSPYVLMDDVQASRDMTTYLIELGHRRIAHIFGHPDHAASEQRLEGFRGALAEHGLVADPSLIVEGRFSFETGRACAQTLLSLADPPTAIVAANDDLAAGAVMAAHEAGLGVPEDLSVAGFDDTHVARVVWPPLTTVHQPIYDLANAAADLLLKRLTGDDSGPRYVELPHKLVIRQSTGPTPSV